MKMTTLAASPTTKTGLNRTGLWAWAWRQPSSHALADGISFLPHLSLSLSFCHTTSLPPYHIWLLLLHLETYTYHHTHTTHGRQGHTTTTYTLLYMPALHTATTSQLGVGRSYPVAPFFLLLSSHTHPPALKGTGQKKRMMCVHGHLTPVSLAAWHCSKLHTHTAQTCGGIRFGFG